MPIVKFAYEIGSLCFWTQGKLKWTLININSYNLLMTYPCQLIQETMFENKLAKLIMFYTRYEAA